MPFKSRRRKVSAAERRYNFSHEVVNYQGIVEKTVKDIAVLSKNEARIETDYQYITHDLIKILVVVGLILALQILLKITNAQNSFF